MRIGQRLASRSALIGGATAQTGIAPPDADIIATVGTVTTTPLPTALPLFATGLGTLGLLGWRRTRKAAAN